MKKGYIAAVEQIRKNLQHALGAWAKVEMEEPTITMAVLHVYCSDLLYLPDYIVMDFVKEIRKYEGATFFITDREKDPFHRPEIVVRVFNREER
jgi:hypothetical protein